MSDLITLTPIQGLIKGDTGKSAYEEAVEQGFEGTVQEWLKSLHADSISDEAIAEAIDTYLESNPLDVDLTGYIKADEADEKYLKKGESGAVDLTGYQTTSEADAKYSTKDDIKDLATKQDVTDALSGISLDGYAKTEDIPDSYTKTEVEALITSMIAAAIDNAVVVAQTYPIQNSAVTAFVTDAAAVYDTDNYKSVSVIDTHKPEEIADDPLGFKIDIRDDNSTLKVTDLTKGEIDWTLSVDSGEYTLYDLTPNREYEYKVLSGDETTASGKIKPTGTVRMIYDPKDTLSDNTRDVGGWQADGGTVKYGMLFRGAHPDVMTEELKTKLVSQLGVKTEIDLTDTSIDRHLDATQIWKPLQTNISWRGFLRDHYKTIGDILTTAMTEIVNGNPTYIHCYEGADRTGIIMWMLQCILGVDVKYLDIDYELTSLSGRTSRLRTGDNMVALRDYLDLYKKDALFDAVLFWCHRAEIDIDLINQYRKAMTNGNPKMLSYTDDLIDIKSMGLDPNTTTDLLDGKGYRVGAQLNTTDSRVYTTAEGYIATGLIYLENRLYISTSTGDGGSICIKGADLDGIRLQFMNASFSTVRDGFMFDGKDSLDTAFDVETLGEKNYKLTFKADVFRTALTGKHGNVEYFRISVRGGEDVVISYKP